MANDGSNYLYEEMLTRLALWLTLGLCLGHLNLEWMGIAMIWALFACIDIISRQEGQHHGAAEALSRYIKMTEREQEQVKRMIKEWESK